MYQAKKKIRNSSITKGTNVLLGSLLFIMSLSKVNIKVTSALLIIFSISNIGIPFTRYICLMSGNCDYSCEMTARENKNDLSLNSDAASCCRSYVIAERITTPFVYETKKNIISSDQFTILPIYNLYYELPAVPQNPAFFHCIPGDDTDPPLHILNSTLLI